MPVAATLASTVSSFSTDVEAGDWLICGLVGWDAADNGVEELATVEAFGVEKAPVEERCRRSNSSCSFGGRRGGEGPVANAVLAVPVLNSLLAANGILLGNNRDISYLQFVLDMIWGIVNGKWFDDGRKDVVGDYVIPQGYFAGRSG